MDRAELLRMPGPQLEAVEKEAEARFLELSRRRAVEGDEAVDKAAKRADLELFWVRQEMKRRRATWR